MYPKRLEKLRSRNELLENLRMQQEELQAAIDEEGEEEEEDKDSQVDHVGSLFCFLQRSLMTGSML